MRKFPFCRLQKTRYDVGEKIKLSETAEIPKSVQVTVKLVLGRLLSWNLKFKSLTLFALNAAAIKLLKMAVGATKRRNKAALYVPSMHARYTFPPALKVKDNVDNNNQIGAFKVKNLVLTTQNEVVGDNAKINDFLEWMKHQGYKQSTIDRRQSALTGLQKLKANLEMPETVKALYQNKNIGKTHKNK